MNLFLFDYNKGGQGVQKNAPPKEGLELFIDIFKREFTSLLKLNLIFIISCIPIITIGPAIGAMTSVTIKMVQDKPSDLFYDFREAFKKNWKCSFVCGFLAIISIFILAWIVGYCINSEGIIFNIIISIVIVGVVLLGISWIYVYPMIVTVDLPLGTILKNSFLLGISHINHSFSTFILCFALLEGSAIFFPLTSPILLLCTFSFVSFISSFCAWEGIKKCIIKDCYVDDCIE